MAFMNFVMCRKTGRRVRKTLKMTISEDLASEIIYIQPLKGLYRPCFTSLLPDEGGVYRSEVLTERDIPSLGVRTGGWVEVDVSAAAAVAAVAVVALVGLVSTGVGYRRGRPMRGSKKNWKSLIENSKSGVRMVRMREEWISI